MLRRFCLAWCGVVCLFAAVPAQASLVWGEKRGEVCEPPSVFYSSRHQGGLPPCCPTDDGVCPGGSACPATGICPGVGTKCVPESVARPNVVLVISDDQGECHYGSAGECRSTQSGTPIPAPATPALDALAATGTVFTVAHNTASWCYPSLNSILTGRYQKSFGGFRSQIADRFPTMAKVLRGLDRAPGTVVDPFDGEARIGGYCTLQGGKFTASSGRRVGFDARVDVGERRIGRIDCVANSQGGAPLCGTATKATYAPLELDGMDELFEFVGSMVYPKPGGLAGEYAMQQFFAWYAPRIPHQPLRAPAEIGTYLFGSDGRTGLFQLGQLCTGGLCPPAVRAFDENNFGTVREYYSNVYLLDANLREIRTFLQKTSEPHCIGTNGQARFAETSPQACRGTWATGITPDPAQNTITIFLSDNGWQLPNSKHSFTENGYRTRLIVNDPRNPTAGYETDALAHSTDVLPSVLGFALDTPPGTQACPTSDFDGTPCDGRDFRAQLGTSAAAGLGGAALAPASALRGSLCGHETRRPVRPARGRYLLTGPDTVGRCALPGGATCGTAADCADGSFCLGGRCTAEGGKTCASNASCPAGAICVGGTCQAGPPCIDDAACTALLGAGATCVDKTAKWCANAPDVACTTASQCPECPTINGRTVPCRRQCLARSLKLYDNGGRADMVDLSIDPDERQLRSGGVGGWGALLSDLGGAYGNTIRSLVCCIDDWWPGEFQGGSLCANATCPSNLTCNE
jgi:hypothetical protein